MLEPLPMPDLCREFLWASLPAKISGDALARGSPRAQRLNLFGGEDGVVLALLFPQTCDLSRDHGIGRGDIAGLGARTDQGVSNPADHADPVCRRSA